MAGLPTQGPLASKLWLISRSFNVIPFSDELLGLTIPQIDWIVQMLANDNPEQIQITKKGEEVLTPEKRKTMTYVDAYNSMRSSTRRDFIDTKIPVKLQEALKRRAEMKSRIVQLRVNNARD